MQLEPQICRVPSRFGQASLASGLEELRLPFKAIQPREASAALDLSPMQFCDPCGTVALGAFAAHYRRGTKLPLSLLGWQQDSYLARVGLKSLAGHQDDYSLRRRDNDRLTNIIEVATAAERADARKHILGVLGIQHAGAKNVIDYCLEEVLRNVEDHADSPVNALVQAQYYEARDQVVLAIADTGYGILWNLRQRNSDIDDHAEAVLRALEPGVSGRNTRKGSNAGLGLTVASRLITRMGGMFQLATGDCVVDIAKHGRMVHRLNGTSWQGVLVSMCVPRSDALDWEGTFTDVMGSL